MFGEMLRDHKTVVEIYGYDFAAGKCEVKDHENEGGAASKW